MLMTTAIGTTLEIDRNPGRIAAAVLDILRCETEATLAFSGHLPSAQSKKWANRRREERKVVRIPITIRPIQTVGRNVIETDASMAVGLARDLSRRGIGLAYDFALKSRYVLVEFDLYGMGALQLVTELRWCRKRGEHDYLAGGRFLGIVMPE